MNVVDSLIVTLGLDPSNFTKGQKEAAAAQAKLTQDAVAKAKAIEDANSKAGESVATLGRKFLGLYVLLTAGRGIKEFVSDVTAADAALGRTAKNLDMSGRTLSAWQNAATVAGGSAEGITGTLRGLTSEMQKAALTGQSSVIPVFRALGINLADARGHARDATDVLRDLNKVYNERKIDPARFSELAHMAGIDDGTIALLEKSTAEFDKLITAQEKYAASAEDIDAAQKRQSGWRQLLITSQSLGRTILTSLTPAIVGAMRAVQDWANKNQDWIKTQIVEKVSQFVRWIQSVDWGQVAQQFGAFTVNVASLATEFIGLVRRVNSESPLVKAFEALGVLLAFRVLAPLGAIRAAIVALGSVTLTPWLATLLGISAAGGVAGAMKAPMTDDYGRTTGNWGGDEEHPYGFREGNAMLGRRVAKSGPSAAGRVVNAIKGAFGFGDGGPGAGVNGVSPDTKMSDLDAKQRDDLIAALAKSEGNPGAQSDYNNPGNIKWGVWARMHGATGGGIAGVAKFPNAATGRAAVESLLFGKSYRDLTIRQAMNRFSPRGDGANDPDRKAAFIASRIGAPASPGSAAATAQPNPQQPFADPTGGMIAGDLSGSATYNHGQLAETKGLIFHHTASRGSPEDIVRILNQRGLGVQYVMDRDGKIFRTLPEGARGAHILPSQINDLSNSNTQGIEVIAKDDNDLTPAQIASGKSFGEAMAKRYPGLEVFGHGEVNPGHRQATEGMSIVSAIRADLGKPHLDPSYKPATIPIAQRNLGTYMGRDSVAPTYDHAARHLLKVLAHARALTSHHNDNRPVPVMLSDRHGRNMLQDRMEGAGIARLHSQIRRYQHTSDAGHYSRLLHMAAAGGYAGNVSHASHHTETRIGEMHVHPQTGDGHRFATEFRQDMMRRGDVVQSNGALA